jgi:hypothetical protein
MPDDETLEAMLTEGATHQQEVTERRGHCFDAVETFSQGRFNCLRPMFRPVTLNSEMEHLAKDPDRPFLSEDAARCVLWLRFRPSDHSRMNRLAAKNRYGKLGPAAEVELNDD